MWVWLGREPPSFLGGIPMVLNTRPYLARGRYAVYPFFTPEPFLEAAER